MSSAGRIVSPRRQQSVATSLRRRLAGWAGIEDGPPVGHESWSFFADESSRAAGRQRRANRADSSDTASISSLGRCDSDSTQGDASTGADGGGFGHSSGSPPPPGRHRTRKRDWFKVLLAARNLATVVYAMSYTTTLPVLPFMANRLIFPRASEGPDDPGSEGVPEAWRGMAYGLVMSGYYFTKMISAPWIGFLSDRAGRRQALVVTLLGGALSFFVTMMWGQHSIQGLILCRLLMGCFAANGALMHAYIRDTVPQEWQSSAFSQHSASWGCAYLAAPALIAWVGDDADTILSVATATMIISAMIVEITFVDTRPEGSRTQRMSRVVSGYIIEGARDLAEVGKKMSGVDLADFFNGGRENNPSPPPPPPVPVAATVGGNGDILNGMNGTRRLLGDSRNTSRESLTLHRRHVVGSNGGSPSAASTARSSEAVGRDGGGGCDASGEGGGNGKLVDIAGRGEGEGEGEKKKGGRPRSGSMSARALVGVFKSMMRERLVLVSFVLQAVRPAQDLAPLVALKFSGGASVLAGITSSRSLCRVLIPMTPLIPWLVRFAGGAPGAAKRGGDRAVAACMCVLMAGMVACVPGVETLRDLHHLMAVKGLCYIVRESTAGAVMARASGTATVGAFFGWQHCIKGVQGTFSHFITGWLSGYSISAPYYVVAICDLLYAFTYLYI